MSNPASSEVSVGWCIHGVAYGPLWACQGCSSGSVISGESLELANR